MKKLWLVLLLALILTTELTAQSSSTFYSNGFTTVAATSAINEIASTTLYHQIQWNVSGTVSTCTVTLDSSPDGTTWTQGGVITSQVCTTNGNSTIVNTSANYVRVNVLTFVGTGTVTVKYLGWQTNPSGGGGVTVIASGTAALGTGGITTGVCATAVTAAATGTATTDRILYTPNVDPSGVTGYAPSASGSLYIWAYPTANNVNFKVCNNTSGTITPSALTLNWSVLR